MESVPESHEHSIYSDFALKSLSVCERPARDFTESVSERFAYSK